VTYSRSSRLICEADYFPVQSEHVYTVLNLADKTNNNQTFQYSEVLIADHRNRLVDTVIRGVECLKSWEKAGLIKMEEVHQVQELLVVLEKKQATNET